MKKLKAVSIFICFLLFISVNVSFFSAGSHLIDLGDEHDHPLNCTLREFLDVCEATCAFILILIILLGVKRITHSVTVRETVFIEIKTPLSRAPPSEV